MNLKIGEDGNSFVSNQSINIPKGNVDIPYTTHIEQAGAIIHGLNEYAGGLQPPTLHLVYQPLTHILQTYLNPRYKRSGNIFGIYIL